MRLVIGLVAVLVVAPVGNPAMAQSPVSVKSPLAAPVSLWEGAEDPAFGSARAAWLAGLDDMAVLAQLAPLAAAGNLAGQVMLGTLVADGPLPEAVAALPRAERIALTRAPGGLSGTSWLTVAAQDHPVVAAMEVSGARYGQVGPNEHVAALEALLAAGATRHAYRLLGIAANQGGFGPTGGWTMVLTHGLHPALRGHGLAFLELVHGVVANPDGGYSYPEAAQMLARALATADPGDHALVAFGMRQSRLRDDTPTRTLAQTLVHGAPQAAPLAGFCALACPETAAACTLALAMATLGQVGHVTLSPFEGLVSSADYQASPRFAADLRARLSQNGGQIARFDACAAAAVGG